MRKYIHWRGFEGQCVLYILKKQMYAMVYDPFYAKAIQKLPPPKKNKNK